jgi:hypothetical protein
MFIEAISFSQFLQQRVDDCSKGWQGCKVLLTGLSQRPLRLQGQQNNRDYERSERVEWVQKLYAPYIRRTFKWEQNSDVSPAEMQARFEQVFSQSIVTILVQEPWHGTVRFKGLARHYADEISELVVDPMVYLATRYGGGKFKLNFHHGWNFVATINFKPQGTPQWQKLPEIEY